MKQLAALVLMAIFVSAPLLAHEEHKQQFTSDRWLKVGIDATTVLFGLYFMQGEFKVSENMSVLARAGYLDTRWTVNSTVSPFSGPLLGGDGIAYGNVALGARWYLKGGCMDGFFIEDYVDFNVGRSFSGNSFSYAGQPVEPWLFVLRNYIDAGYSWVTSFGLFFDVLAGISTSVYFGFPNPPSVTQMVAYHGRVNVGWSF